MGKKEKVIKEYGNNVAPIWRWILAAVLAIVVGGLLGGIMGYIIKALPFFKEGAYLFPEQDLLVGIASFAGIYLMFAVFIKKICKTKLRDFLFGVGRRPDIKGAWKIGGIFVICLILASLVDIKYIGFDFSNPGLWFINLLFVLLFLWIQTTTEEIMFRGLFLRAPFGNEIPSLKKGIIAAVISSLAFMALHLPNPEVTSRSGIDAVIIASSYFLSGMSMFVPNLYLGGLEGGVLIHWLNNFICFVVIKQEVTVMSTPTLFVDHIPLTSPIMTLLNVVISEVPILILSLVLIIRREKEKKSFN